MTNYVWASGQSGDWSDKTNWTPNGVPGSGDDVSINALGDDYTVTISADVDVNSVTVVGDGATVALNGITLTAATYSNGDDETLSGYGTVAAVYSGGGAIVAQNGTLNFSVADDVFSGPISGAGTLEISANASFEGASVSVGTLLIQGAGVTVTADDDVTFSTNLTLGGATFVASSYNNGADETLSGFGTFAAAYSGGGAIVAQGATALDFTVAGDVFSGPISGTGTLEIAANAGLDGASITVANLQIVGSGTTVTVDDDVTITSNITVGAGATFSVDDAVTASGVNVFNGAVTGTGIFTVSGGSETFQAGATLSVDELLQSGGSIVFDETLTVSTALNESSGSISVGLDFVLNVGGDDNFAGAVSGLGTLNLDGSGGATFGAATLTVSAITISGDETITFDDALTYSGVLTQQAGTILIDDSLTLSGADTLSGAVSGADLTISGGVTTVSGAGALSVSQLNVSAGAVLTIASTGDDILTQVTNAGVILIETNDGGQGAGVSFDDNVVMNSKGVIKIADNASVEFGANIKGGTIAFQAGSDELLEVDDLTATGGAGHTINFGATIQNFGTGDSLDIVGTTVTGLSQAQSGGNTILTVSTADDEVIFTLAGNYSNLVFHDDDSLITVSPLITTPVFTGAGVVTPYYETGAPVTVDATLGLTPTNDEIKSATVTISSGFLSGDTLEYTLAGGVSASFNAKGNVLTFTGLASAATYAQIFDSITFSSSNANPTNSGKDKSRTLTFTATSGPDTSTPVTTTIVLKPLPATEVVQGANASFTEGGSAVEVASSVIIESSSQTKCSGAKIKIGHFFAGDMLTFDKAIAKEDGIHGVYNALTGVLTFTGSATFADYQTVLESVMFSSTSINPTDFGEDSSRQLTWTITAGGETSKPVTTNVGVIGVDAAPTLVHGGNLDGYKLGKAAIVVDSVIKAKDVDSADLKSATVTISGGFSDGDDTLGWSAALAAKFGLSAAYDSATGVLSFIGTATLAQYDRILQGVTFSSSSTSTSQRTISWTVSDGTRSSAATQTTIDIKAPAVAQGFDFRDAAGLIGGHTGGTLTNSAYLVGTAVVVDPFFGSLAASPNA